MTLSDFIKKRKVETTGEFKTLELTDEQYRRLLLLCALGMKTIVRDDKTVEIGLLDIDQYIMSFAKKFNSSDLINYDFDYEYYSWTEKLRIETKDIMDHYSDHIFLYEISNRLALRDLKLHDPENEKTKDEIEKIRWDYFNEIEKNDVENLKLMK